MSIDKQIEMIMLEHEDMSIPQVADRIKEYEKWYRPQRMVAEVLQQRYDNLPKYEVKLYIDRKSFERLESQYL